MIKKNIAILEKKMNMDDNGVAMNLQESFVKA